MELPLRSQDRFGWEGRQMTKYSPDVHAERLLALSEEVKRIAGSLAELSTSDAPDQQPAPRAEIFGADVPEKTVRWLIRARRERARYFSPGLFADPAWDILLDLFQAELTQRRATVGSVSAAADVPPTTALRWLKTLEDQKLIVRSVDPTDRRRIFVELTREASASLRRWFAESLPPR
jgi:DNA-binding MarR family transcriptional regulator